VLGVPKNSSLRRLGIVAFGKLNRTSWSTRRVNYKNGLGFASASLELKFIQMFLKFNFDTKYEKMRYLFFKDCISDVPWIYKMEGGLPNLVERYYDKGCYSSSPSNGTLMSPDGSQVVTLVMKPYYGLLGTMECYEYFFYF